MMVSDALPPILENKALNALKNLISLVWTEIFNFLIFVTATINNKQTVTVYIAQQGCSF